MKDEASQQVDFRKTLNLPQTEFAMKAGLAQKEPLYLAKWEKEGLYQRICQQLAGKPKFILHDGPPYANGNIHIGHALNKTLKDLIVKSKAMQGFDSHYLPGWDCHGLPIEHALLKEMKKRKSDVDCVDFRKKAHDYAMKYVGIQRDEFKRLGIFGEWEKPYLTLNTEYEYWILKSLSELFKKGYVYRGLKPVNWCFSCETALAEAEVEYEDHTSQSMYVKFKVENKETKPLYLLIWTTTPWTLMANVAVAVHPNFKYVVVDTGKEVLIMEKSLSAAVLAKVGVQSSKILREVEGGQLTTLTYEHPFGLRKNCRVVTADYVTKEDGTGLVHTAPGHGQEDFETGLKYKLDVVMPVNDKGVYTSEAGPYAGEHVFKANDKIIEELKQKGALFHKEPLQHTYPHCWRCKNPIIFRATRQWFMKIDHDGLRQKLLKAIQKDVKWVPPAGEERITAMVATRPDWCLSRQRFWGVPIPAIRSKKEGSEPQLYPEVIDHFAEIVRREGTNAWFEKDIKQLLPKGFKDPKTGEAEFEKTFDILDVWFDSGVSHQAVVKGILKEKLPIDLYLEGSDQHRGWFQSSLIPAVAIEGKPPFKEVLTHGFVVDGAGRKMSKSLGNVVSPQDVIKESGADILRLWVTASSYNEDIRISKEVLERLVDAYRKIRNTIRYLLSNLYDFDPDKEMLDYKDLKPLDKWALHQLAKVMEESYKNFNEYEFAKIYKSVYTFCNEELSNFYLDILKDRLYISAAQSRERKSAQNALYHILNYSVRLLAPVLVFTCEEIFEHMPKDKELKKYGSVHLLQWLKVPGVWKDEEISKRFELLLRLRPHVMKALEDKRREGTIGSSLEAKVIFKTASERDYTYLTSFGEELADMFVVSQAHIEKAKDIAGGIDNEFLKTQISVVKADGKKCARSWKYSLDVGSDPQFPALSLKSAKIVKEMLHASS
ncbi:MAG TPA: isoleucine--tRNA ligase [Candidatus Omnitrophota bacterium]|nr:isoleucine--tRNA ligase [Candidatus Omnitrophota bacterium]